MSGDTENPRLPEIFTAHERTIQAAHNNPQQPETYRTPTPPSPEARSGAVETRTYNPLMLQYIARVTGGDTSRLIYNPDGSITVANHPQR
jgi:hypothetical protein